LEPSGVAGKAEIFEVGVTGGLGALSDVGFPRLRWNILRAVSFSNADVGSSSSYIITMPSGSMVMIPLSCCPAISDYRLRQKSSVWAWKV